MASIPAGGMHGASHEVLGRLAVGGMAELYLAQTTHEDGRREVVVLKRILPHLSEDPEFVRMFRDEAFLAATLDHPNIVHVHDIGQDGEDYFFTMEYVHGENVRTIIKAAQKQEVDIPLEHVLEIAYGVCEGLHYAHEQVDDDGSPLRIVHRDVSPTNIIVSYDGELKIVDFGIAKAAAATHVTQAGMLKGKASYMSPEQCRADPVDRRSDVFAIGILLYEMTTLTRVFRGDNELAILHQILTGAIDPPSTRVERHYPPELERIVMRALQSRPDDRYPTAKALQEDLVRFAAAESLHPSAEALGDYLRELCGDKPYPWVYDDEPEADEAGLEAGDVSGTGMPTAAGSFEDEDDTKVNRRAPNQNLRTIVPGAPSGWEGSELEEPTGTTNRQLAPKDRARPGGRMPARIQPAPRPGAPRPSPSPSAPAADDASDSRRKTATPIDDPSRRTPTPRGPVPRGGPERPLPAEPRTGRTLAPTSPDAPSPPKPFAARSGRTLAGASGGLAGPLPARSGRTVPGTTTRATAGAPDPARLEPAPGASPLPSAGSTAVPPGAASSASRPASRPGRARRGAVSAQMPLQPTSAGDESGAAGKAGTADRTMAMSPEQAAELARLGKAASPGGPVPLPVPVPVVSPGAGQDRTMAMSPEQAAELARLGKASSPGGRAPLPAPVPVPSPGAGQDRTMAMSPEQAAELARLGKAAAPASAGGQDHTMALSADQAAELARLGRAASPPARPAAAGRGAEVDEGASTIAVPRFSREQLMGEPPAAARGPLGWGDDDPLTRTQRNPASDPLTSTQRSPASGMPRPNPSKDPSSVVSLTSTQRSPSSVLPLDLAADLRRPQMRSPAPRPESTPRSLWVPVLVVVVLGLAGTGAWMWYAGIGPFARDAPEASPNAPTPSASTNPSEPTAPAPAPVGDPGATPSGGDATPGAAPSDDETAAEPAAGSDTGEATAEAAGGSTSAAPSDEPSADPPPSKRRRRRPSSSDGGGEAPPGEVPGIKPGRPVPP